MNNLISPNIGKPLKYLLATEEHYHEMMKRHNEINA